MVDEGFIAGGLAGDFELLLPRNGLRCRRWVILDPSTRCKFDLFNKALRKLTEMNPRFMLALKEQEEALIVLRGS
jgi:hypothetical protein